MKIMSKSRNISIASFHNQIGWALIVIGCIFQILVYNGNWISLVSGLAGVIAVVLCSMRKMSQFFFSFLQLGTYLVLCWNEKLWGEVGINIFYFFMMILAIFTWKSGYNGIIVNSRFLGKFWNWVVAGITGLFILVLWKFLQRTSDPQPFMDSLTTIPAITAQVLMTFRFREQWIYWSIINLGSIWMWYVAEDPNMVCQYIFWTINCLYGWKMWGRQ